MWSKLRASNYFKVKLLHFFGLFYHREVQSIADPLQIKRRFVRHQLLNLVFGLELVRCLVIWYSTLYNDDTWFKYDLLFQMRRNVMHFDPYMVLCFCSLFLFMMAHNTIYYYASGQFTWKLVIDLVMVNSNDFCQNNRSILSGIYELWSHSHLLQKPILLIKTIKRCVNLWNNQEYLNGHRVKFRYQLRYFPFVSNRVRVRTFMVVVSWELLLTLVLCLIMILMSITLPGTVQTMMPMSMNWFSFMITLLDVSSTFYLGWIGFKIGCFALYTQLTILYAINCSFKELDQFVERRILKRTNQCRVMLANDMSYFRREHARLVRYILKTDDWYWSAGLCNFFVNNIPINVYLITYLVFKPIDQVEQMFIQYILAIQLFAFLLSMVPAAKASQLAHNCNKYLFALQIKLNGRSLPLKFKYMTFHEQVASSKLIGYHMGAFFQINHRTIFEFMIIYFGFYIYTIRLVA